MGFARLPDTTGFDEQLDLLVLSRGQSTNLYLPNFAGQPITVRSANPGVASITAEVNLTDAQRNAALPPSATLRQNPFDKNIGQSRFGGVEAPPVLAWFPMSKITVRGESVGETQLLAELADRTSWQNPTRVVVVQNANSRQIDTGPVPLSLVRELQSMRLRDAAVRVAQDQIRSSFTKHGGGDGRYALPGWVPAPKDWCGAFVYWCYRKAAEIKGAANPFGADNDVMLSPQKAITWALSNRGIATLVRYQGGALYQFPGAAAPAPQDDLIEAVPGTNLLAGDVCLLRKADGSNWQHVCLVYDPGSGDSFVTLDGNQGSPSMKMVVRDMSERVPGGAYRYVFVHLNLP